MVAFNALTHVDDVRLAVEVEHVVLAEIRVYESTHLQHNAHVCQHINIHAPPLRFSRIVELNVLKPRRGVAFLAVYR